MSIDLQPVGSLEPDVLAVLRRAFDDVWLQVEPQTRLVIRDATRDAIATALIQAAMSGERDPEKLWCHAMNRARALSTLDWMSKQAPSTTALPGAKDFLSSRIRQRGRRSPV